MSNTIHVSDRTLETLEHLAKSSIDAVTNILYDNDCGGPVPAAVFTSKNKLFDAIHEFFHEVRVFVKNGRGY